MYIKLKILAFGIKSYTQQFRISQYAELFVVSTKLADLLCNGIDMKCLIYDNGLSGHHLEYLYNIHQAVATDSRNEYIFAIPESFNEKNLCFLLGSIII